MAMKTNDDSFINPVHFYLQTINREVLRFYIYNLETMW